MARIKKLSKEVKLKIGYPCVATMVKRTKKVAMYLRDDGAYEVFKIRHMRPVKNEKLGIVLGWREHYPSTSEFTMNYAICTKDKVGAEEAYIEFVEQCQM